MEIPQEVEGFERGDRVRVRLLTDEDKLRQSLVVIGSHDPLIDELADMLHRADHGISLSSTHVGSMGGIIGDKARRGACRRLPFARYGYGRV